MPVKHRELKKDRVVIPQYLMSFIMLNRLGLNGGVYRKVFNAPSRAYLKGFKFGWFFLKINKLVLICNKICTFWVEQISP